MSSSHPVDLLVAEHEVILQVLDAIEHQIVSLNRGGDLVPRFWTDAGDFIVNFADRRHHGKEEDLLFPAMVEHGFPSEAGPIGVMKAEHVQGRDCTRRMREAASQGDREALVRAATEYVVLLREHIGKENMVLFEMARQALSPPAVDALRASFPQVDREMDRQGDYFAVAERLCRDSGLAFRRPDMPSL